MRLQRLMEAHRDEKTLSHGFETMNVPALAVGDSYAHVRPRIDKRLGKRVPWLVDQFRWCYED